MTPKIAQEMCKTLGENERNLKNTSSFGVRLITQKLLICTSFLPYSSISDKHAETKCLSNVIFLLLTPMQIL